MATMGDEWAKVEKPPQGLQICLPLSDKCVDLKGLNTALSSAQTREKSLKIMQYSAKLAGYFLVRAAGEYAKTWGKHFEALAKQLSTARRFFKLMRWWKHFEDIKDARDEKSAGFKKLLYLDIACNVAADISEDVTSLEKVGILRKGTLPARTEYYSNWAQLVLAVVEISVSWIKAGRAREKARAPGATTAVQQKRAMAELEFSKYIADLIKAFWDCELSFASELAFCMSGLWAAFVSTHKYALKALK
mmetsp:Transcript_28829/g.73077  ORF Transcript_28829/g.73077 Transcript_28829/m.73077 type:complete len:248 (-) Transcript_28829:76-819(-)